MALVNMGGGVATLETNTTNGTQTLVTDATGNYIRTNPTTTAIGYWEFRRYASNGDQAQNFDVATLGVRFWYRVPTGGVPATGENFFAFYDNAGTPAPKAFLRLKSDRTIEVRNQAGTLIATGATVLALDTWYVIGFSCGTSATVGAYTLQINGVAELSGTMDTLATNHGRLRLGKVTNTNGNSVDFHYKYILIDNAAIPAFSINSQQVTLPPVANGATMQWTAGTGASDYTQVALPYSAATYVMTNSTTNQVALFDYQNTSVAGITGTINAVKVLNFIREDVTATTSTKLRHVSGATTTDLVASDISTTDRQRCAVLTTDPNTGAAWTLAGLDAFQAGMHEANAVATRLSGSYLVVDYTPPTLAAGSTSIGFGSSGAVAASYSASGVTGISFADAGAVAVAYAASGSAAISFATAGAAPIVGLDAAGSTGITFANSGGSPVLALAAAGTTSVAFSMLGTVDQTVGVAGAASVTFGMVANAGVLYPITGSTAIGFGAVGAVAASLAASGSTGFTFSTSGSSVIALDATGTTAIVFSPTGNAVITRGVEGVTTIVFAMDGTAVFIGPPTTRRVRLSGREPLTDLTSTPQTLSSNEPYAVLAGNEQGTS